MKSYTDLNQSKKLAEILPLESADMCYLSEESLVPKVIYNGMTFFNSEEERLINSIHCWSLAALFNLCPTINGKQPILTRGKITRLWYCYYEDEIDTQTYDNPVDAVFEMTQLLHEQKLI